MKISETTHQAAILIVAKVCHLRSVSVDAVMHKCGYPQVVSARNEAMAICREELRMTFVQIAQFFEKHHTSVIHAINSHRSVLEIYPPESSRKQLAQELYKQSRLIAAQASTISEQACRIKALTESLVELRFAVCSHAGQEKLFRRRQSA